MPTVFSVTIGDVVYGDADYDCLRTAEAALESDYRYISSTMVFSHSGITGNIPDGVMVTGKDSGATGYVLHATDTQILLQYPSGSFQNGEQVYYNLDTDYVICGGDFDTPIVQYNCQDVTPDTTAAIWGSATDADNYIIVNGMFPEDGVFDTNIYWIENSGSMAGLQVRDLYTRVQNLQIQVNESGTANRYGIYVINTTGSNIYIDSVIIEGNCTGTGWGVGIQLYDGTGGTNLYISNAIVYGFSSGSNSQMRGIWSNYNPGGETYCYNCTVYDCYYGIRNSNGGVTAVNCAVGNCADDFYDVTASYCCSDDGDGSNSQSPAGGDWANEFINAANGDFNLLPGGNCVDNGDEDPGAGLYSDDCIGISRPRRKAWDIGAFEYPVMEQVILVG